MSRCIKHFGSRCRLHGKDAGQSPHFRNGGYRIFFFAFRFFNSCLFADFAIHFVALLSVQDCVD